ncbi:MAG: hypothetical protein O6952_08615, partial [Planctomycetota bacterium]|nr:hypothetical protein [Planctomycetota bacterium]
MLRALRYVTLLIVAIGLAPALWADRIVLKNGETIEGTIVLEASGKLTIQTATGIRKIRSRDILKIEKGKSVLEIYREKAGALGSRDATGHSELALWCKDQGLAAEAKAEF